MRVLWQISAADIAAVREIVQRQQDSPFMKDRIRRNLASTKPRVDKSRFWREMVSCLLTTQQRSGPTSPITRFICARPFPLAYDVCRARADVEQFALGALSEFGGIRRAPTLSAQIAENLSKLEQELWDATLAKLEPLYASPDREVEVSAAQFIDVNFRGFGPKQARNLLQGLGLTRYEIPIDSRIAKWLVDLGFPVALSPAALGDARYYDFISSAIQKLCAESDVFPCVLDAAVFSSFDKMAWTHEAMPAD